MRGNDRGQGRHGLGVRQLAAQLPKPDTAPKLLRTVVEKQEPVHEGHQTGIKRKKD